jgi:hypothetical protein
MAAYGFPQQTITHFACAEKWSHMRTCLPHTAPYNTFESIFTALFTAEITAAEQTIEHKWSQDTPAEVSNGVYGSTITNGIKASNPKSVKCLLTWVIN